MEPVYSFSYLSSLLPNPNEHALAQSRGAATAAAGAPYEVPRVLAAAGGPVQAIAAPSLKDTFPQVPTNSVDYRLIKKLGDGSFSTVIHAKVKTLDRKTISVAMKRSTPNHHYSDKTDYKSSLNEEHIIRILNPHDKDHLVVRLYGGFDIEDRDRMSLTRCSIYELLAGDLHQLLRPAPIGQPPNPYRLNMYHLRNIGAQALNALTFLKKHGIVHCDIKPRNIGYMFQGDSIKIILIDFGISFEEKSPPAEHTLLVTSWYRPPELACHTVISKEETTPALKTKYNEQMTSAIDTWTMGAIFGEMYLGEPLINPSGNNDIAEQHKVLAYISHLCGPLNRHELDNSYLGKHIIQEWKNGLTDPAIKPKWEQYFDKRSLKRYQRDPAFERLIMGMMQLDPKKRHADPSLLEPPKEPQRE